MPVESRRMDIFSSPNIPDNEQTHVARPFTNTIRGRGVCIQLIFTEEEEEKMKFSFFVLFSPWHRFKYEWGGKFCDMCDGWFSFIFIFFFFIILSKYTEKKGRRVFRFSTVHRTGWVCVMVEWVVNCTALGHYRTSGSVLHPSTDARLYAVWCFWSAERTPLLFFSSSSSFYLLELLPAPPLCAEWVVNTWYVCDRLFFFLSLHFSLVSCSFLSILWRPVFFFIIIFSSFLLFSRCN